MAEESYEPLFPAGSELHVAESFERFDRQPTRWCRMLVDDEIVLNADAAGADGFEDAGTESRGLDLADAEQVPGEFDAVVWPGVAMATAPCAVPGPGGHTYIDQLTLVLETEHPGIEDESVRVLSEVIQPLFAGVLEMTPCAENGGR